MTVLDDTLLRGAGSDGNDAASSPLPFASKVR
jgi:hypothetical protein